MVDTNSVEKAIADKEKTLLTSLIDRINANPKTALVVLAVVVFLGGVKILSILKLL